MADALLDTVLKEAGGAETLLIAGPTASGKSALAVAAARALGGVVVNADSMQVYHGPRTLTARPTPEEEAAVEHRLYGFVDPRTAFSTGDYLRAVAPVLANLRASGRPAIVVGGTGLYFRALTQGLVETPEIPPHVVDEVRRLGEGAALHAWLAARDPARAAELKPADTPRLQRAASIWLATGRSLKEWQATPQPPVLAPDSWRGFFLDADRETLHARINARFRRMIAEGAMDEARAVSALGLAANRGVMKAHGMPHLLRHLADGLPLEDAIRLGQLDTRKYARRQRIWARRYMADWRWLAA
jgi:tRNA dimethylallyltransferase